MDEEKLNEQEPEEEKPTEYFEEEEEEEELGHSDKLVGVFTEPGATFSAMADQPKTTDWLIPLLLVIVLAIASNFIYMSNPIIRQQAIEKQVTAIDEAVEAGTITQEQADQQKNFIQNGDQAMKMQLIFQSIGTVIVLFILFFLLSLVYFLLAKFALKGEGSYKSAMSAYGLPGYISAIQIVVMIIIAMSADKLVTGTSLAILLDSDKQTFSGYLISFIDPFKIWFFALLSIGLAKMFKSESNGKYYGAVFGLWIGFSIIFFFIAQAVPFFKSFIM
ncbi:MAG: YckD family protein [Melioribacteraceae bacterium]|nr:YckD family protein [Melioribacteraceae bacterium]MCF8353781.1 YckD family protein [Melioribacteraceae bacterium]MCF8393617.1 YckD family protein [Melioribacteraceae bacterium]MCF8419427.1 YckD family protein [Melioribacteraceae bacterium]